MPVLFAPTSPEPGPRLQSTDMAAVVGTTPQLIGRYANLGLLHWESVDKSFHDARRFAPTDVAVAAILNRLFGLGIRDREASAAASVACYGWGKGQLPQHFSPATHALWRSDEARRWVFELRRLRGPATAFWAAWVYPVDDPPAFNRKLDIEGSIGIVLNPLLRPIRERLIALGELADGPVLAHA